MRKTQRFAAVGAAAALTLVLGACAGEDQAAAPAPGATTAPSMSMPAPTSDAMESGDMAMGDGVTTADDTFGEACSALPQGSEPGSLDAMGPQPVATAASTNPLLTTLTTAVQAADLVDTLNGVEAATVFAPTDDAFAAAEEALGADAFAALLEDQAGLGALLQYHVSGTRYDRDGLVEAGTVQELNGSDLTIAEAGDTITVTDGMGNTATVLCGNIPTENATVFVIDSVLMPAAE